MPSDTPPDKSASLRTIAMPKDTNPAGDIFGGWLMSQMDIASALIAQDRAKGRVATVGVENMAFLKPVKIGDVVSVYGTIIHEGRSSLRIDVEAWCQRRHSALHENVARGIFAFVCLDEQGNKRPLPF